MRHEDFITFFQSCTESLPVETALPWLTELPQVELAYGPFLLLPVYAYCLCICMYMYVHTYTYVHNIYIYINMYVCMYVYIYMYDNDTATCTKVKRKSYHKFGTIMFLQPFLG